MNDSRPTWWTEGPALSTQCLSIHCTNAPNPTKQLAVLCKVGVGANCGLCGIQDLSTKQMSWTTLMPILPVHPTVSSLFVKWELGQIVACVEFSFFLPSRCHEHLLTPILPVNKQVWSCVRQPAARCSSSSSCHWTGHQWTCLASLWGADCNCLATLKFNWEQHPELLHFCVSFSTRLVYFITLPTNLICFAVGSAEKAHWLKIHTQVLLTHNHMPVTLIQNIGCLARQPAGHRIGIHAWTFSILLPALLSSSGTAATIASRAMHTIAPATRSRKIRKHLGRKLWLSKPKLVVQSTQHRKSRMGVVFET